MTQQPLPWEVWTRAPSLRTHIQATVQALHDGGRSPHFLLCLLGLLPGTARVIDWFIYSPAHLWIH